MEIDNFSEEVIFKADFGDPDHVYDFTKDDVVADIVLNDVSLTNIEKIETRISGHKLGAFFFLQKTLIAIDFISPFENAYYEFRRVVYPDGKLYRYEFSKIVLER